MKTAKSRLNLSSSKSILTTECAGTGGKLSGKRTMRGEVFCGQLINVEIANFSVINKLTNSLNNRPTNGMRRHLQSFARETGKSK